VSSQIDRHPATAPHASSGAEQPRPAEIQGVVDNVSAGRIFGWAWNPSQPEERVAVELRLGREVVAQTMAAQERSDLQGAGVGDGCHAFELRLTPELIQRRAEIFVVARTADGLEVPLPILGARRVPAAVDAQSAPQGAPHGAHLSRSVQMLSGAHRALQEQIEDLNGRLPGSHAALEDLTLRVETLELWCLRLDERLAAQAGSATPMPGTTRPRLDRWQIALIALALLGILSSLGFAWVGAFPALGAG
jgi:hypothetical protein